MNLAEPIDIRTGRPFADRVHPHHRETPLERASTGGRARGLLGGLFGGCMMAAQSKAWTNPYVTSGLVAMWDGEWNAGGGVHDATATTWVDLSGNGNDAAVQTGTFAEKSLQALLVDGAITPHRATIANSSFFFSPVVASGEFTTEICSNNMSLANTFNNFLFVFADTRSQYFLIRPSGWYNGHYYSSYNWGYIGYGYWNGLSIGCGLKNGMTASWTASADGRIGYRNGVNYVTGSSVSMSTVYSNPVYLRGAGDTYSVRFYSRALTASEVAANYAVDAARFGLT